MGLFSLYAFSSLENESRTRRETLQPFVASLSLCLRRPLNFNSSMKCTLVQSTIFAIVAIVGEQGTSESEQVVKFGWCINGSIYTDADVAPL